MTTTDWRQRAAEARLEVRDFIDGQHHGVAGDGQVTKHFSADGRFLYDYGRGTRAAVDRAVSAARKAFQDKRWQGKSFGQRKAVLMRLAELLLENRDDLALRDCLDVGKPITKALADVAGAAGVLRATAEKMDKQLSPYGCDGAFHVYQMRKPLGVVGAIVGWNFPLSLAVQKLAPALAMGNSLVLKPSEFTPLSAGKLVELAAEAGVPDGVVNLVNGVGATVGDALARHDGVDLLTFVGSSATGKQLMVAAGESNMKRLILECGGKSPFIVFDDCAADLDFLAQDIVADTAFKNMGQLCVAGTRLLVQESMVDELMPKIIAEAEKIRPSDPLDASTAFGPLMSEGHLKKVLSYVSTGQEQGARLLTGGCRLYEDEGGSFMAPTVFDQVNPDQVLAQEEIFGPVLSVFTFNDEAEAIALANNSRYGLAAYVATTNVGRAHRLARQLQAGALVLMGTDTPTGGSVSIKPEAQKQSGFGVEELSVYTSSTTVYGLV